MSPRQPIVAHIIPVRRRLYPTYPRVRSGLDADLKKQWRELANLLGEAKRQLGIPTRPLAAPRTSHPPNQDLSQGRLSDSVPLQIWPLRISTTQLREFTLS